MQWFPALRSFFFLFLLRRGKPTQGKDKEHTVERTHDGAEVVAACHPELSLPVVHSGDRRIDGDEGHLHSALVDLVLLCVKRAKPCGLKRTVRRT